MVLTAISTAQRGMYNNNNNNNGSNNNHKTTTTRSQIWEFNVPQFTIDGAVLSHITTMYKGEVQ